MGWQFEVKHRRGLTLYFLQFLHMPAKSFLRFHHYCHITGRYSDSDRHKHDSSDLIYREEHYKLPDRDCDDYADGHNRVRSQSAAPYKGDNRHPSRNARRWNGRRHTHTDLALVNGHGCLSNVCGQVEHWISRNAGPSRA